MTEIFGLFARIPKAGRIVGFLLMVLVAAALIYRRWGLWPTVVVIAGFALIWLAIILYDRAMKVKERQDGIAFGKALEASQQGPSREEVKHAVADLGRKWQEAMTNLKQHNIDLYQLPWYMLIGEPQSGKSTTLKFSGLRFPIGQESISGGGGTRNCDWWFTDQGVILDTAGRFTFHEETATDSAEWNTFLDLLSKHRPYCPINGIILVIPMDALLSDSPDIQKTKARNISNKLLNIQRQLAIQFPVYVMVTKSDQSYGFTQFFNKFGPDQQREIFGWSNPQLSEGFDPQAFDDSFEAIVRRLDALRSRNLSQTQYVDDLDKTYIFPEEFRVAQNSLRFYLETIFQPTVYKDPLFFRGYYFSSGMQEGQPIVSACSAMIPSSEGLEKLENVFQRSRAFFVRDFYALKVFPEEGLVRRAAHFLRKDTLKKRMIYGLNAAMLVLGGLFVWWMYSSLSKSLEEPKLAIDRANQQLLDKSDAFFQPQADRKLIYDTLTELRTGVQRSSEKNYLVFLRSKKNALTRHLQNTFGYLFLDRIMLDLIERLVGNDAANPGQLRQFKLDAPTGKSEDDLKSLLAALTELKTWQLQVRQRETLDFQPSIRSFLDITVKPEWDLELAEHRQDSPVTSDLNLWFGEVYDLSNENVRRYLIEETVRRSGAMYDNLHNRVADFYSNQPELLLYQRKLDLLSRLDFAYRNLQDDNADPTAYHDNLLALAEYFSEENRQMMADENDVYLSFEQIRTETIKAMGPAFTELGATGEPPSVDRRRQAERDLFQDDGVRFVRRLLDMQTQDLPDPRTTTPPGESGNLGYPAYADDLWENIIQPYMTYAQADSAYQGIPDSAENLKTNLSNIFQTGSDRVRRVTTTLDTNVNQHMDFIENQRAGRQFGAAMLKFHDHLVLQEQTEIGRLVAEALAGNVDAVPAPPRNWRGFLNKYDELKNRDGFRSGPNQLKNMFQNDFQFELRTIYKNSGSPVGMIDSYNTDLQNRLSAFDGALAALRNVPTAELGKNKSKYRNPPEFRNIERLADGSKVPTVMSGHHNTVSPWADAAKRAWLSHVNNIDPCPECKTELAKLKSSYEDLKPLGFPLSYQGQVSLKPSEDRTGYTDVEPHLSNTRELDAFLRQIEFYRTANQDQLSHIEEVGLKQFMKDALAWSQAVRELRLENINFQFTVDFPKPGEIEGPELTQEADLTHLRVEGAFTSGRMLLTSPRFITVTSNAEESERQFSLFFYNEDDGNNTDARLFFNSQYLYLDLAAFAVDGAQVSENNTRFRKAVDFDLSIPGRRVTGILVFKTDKPLPPPPDWSVLER